MVARVQKGLPFQALCSGPVFPHFADTRACSFDPEAGHSTILPVHHFSSDFATAYKILATRLW